jgi:hypothetical protein
MGRIYEMTTKEVLIKARKLIEKPEAWCQGNYRHFNANGDAVRWCPKGSLMEITCRLSVVSFSDALGTLERALGAPKVAVWNDTPGRTHDEVLALFDRAIREAE